MKDLVSTVVYCNCAIVIVIFIVTLLTLKLRAQIVAVANWCDRQEQEWDLLMAIESRQAIEASGNKIRSARQLYQQQLSTIDRVRSIRSVWGVVRTVARQRIRKR